MPSCSQSSALGEPRHSKSFSSARPQQLRYAKSFNTSELAHHQARTAAELAFERARGRHAVENGYKNSFGVNVIHSPLRSNRPQLGRRHSVRFTGPNAVMSRALPNTRREVTDHRDDHDLENTVLRPEFVETIVASEPSSYRKLRKARSMFTPDKAPSVVSTDGTNTSRSHFKYNSMRSSDSYNDTLRPQNNRLRRSFSFLRGVTDRLSMSDKQLATNDAAIQIARDQYLLETEDQKLKEQPSFFNIARRRISSKELRRSVRVPSMNGYSTAIPSPLPPVEPLTIKRNGRKTRIVSQTLKRALRKVFGRPMPDEPKLPEQHLSATRAHYGEESLDDDNDDQHYSPIPSPDIELLRRVNSHESILRELPGYKENQAPAEHVRSLATEGQNSGQQSRVTSWTNSIVANTIDMPQFVERKRLSIIKEDSGPHQPSSSVGRSANPTHGYAVFGQPVRLDSGVPAAAQRVYSALQREIRKSEHNAALGDGISRTDSSWDLLSSKASHGPLRRHQSGHNKTEVLFTTEPPPSAISMSRSRLFNPDPTVTVGDPSLRPKEVRCGLPDCEYGYVEPVDRLTPQQIAHLNEPEVPPPKRPLYDVKSAFFPSESQFERREMSPYRRAMYDSSIDADQVEDNIGDSKPIIRIEPRRYEGPMRKSSAALSESIYSRTEGGHSPREITSSVSLPKTDSSDEPGTAVIITGGLQSSEISLRRSSQSRKASDRSSGEWKRWMASQVSHFEDHCLDSPPVKGSGHRRENAQWDGEDVAIGKLSQLIQSTNQPLGTLQMTGNARPALQERMSRSNVMQSPFQNVTPFGMEGTNLQKGNTVETRSQISLLKKWPMTEDENSLSSSTGTTIIGPRTKASQVQLSPYSDERSSPASSHGCNSPGRVEQFRRLQNKTSEPPFENTSPTKNSSHVKVIQAAHTTPTNSPYRPKLAAQSFSNPGSQIVSDQALVGEFFKSRRSLMRIRDDSEDNQAFL